MFEVLHHLFSHLFLLYISFEKHFGDRGRMNNSYKADITGDSVFQQAQSSFKFKSTQQLMRNVFAFAADS